MDLNTHVPIPKNKKQKETKNLVDSCKLRFAGLID